MSTIYDIDCELNYTVLAPSTFVFKIEAARHDDQSVLRETLTSSPPLPMDRFVDHLGNRTVRINAEPGPFGVRYRAAVEMRRAPANPELREVEVAQLPLEVLPFVGGSRYVESELLFNEALQWIGSGDRGWRRVDRICEWVRQNITYEIGTSQAYGTARDVLANRTGVCRDYAHVAIGLCRALNIPARFVVGHVQWDTPPPDFHALFEAWLDDRWVLFDPTQMADPGDVIRIGTGYDAADLPFATIFGSARMERMNPLVFATKANQPVAARAA